MRVLPLSCALLLAAPACGDTAGTGQDTGGGGGSGREGADTGPVEQEPVWADLRMETSDALLDAYASGAGLYVVTDAGEAWLRQGGTWSGLDLDVGGESLNGLWGAGSGEDLELVAVGDAGTIARYAAGAWTVEDIGTANLDDVDGPTSSELLAVGWGGVYRLADGVWTYEAIEGNPKFNDAWTDGTVAVAVGEDGAIGWWQDGTWTVTQHKSRARLAAVDAASATNVWAVGEAGTVLHWDGLAWEQLDLGTKNPLWGVHVADSGTVYVVGNGGFAARWTGSAWERLPTGVDNVLYAVTSSPTGVIWAVGNRGMTLRYDPSVQGR